MEPTLFVLGAKLAEICKKNNDRIALQVYSSYGKIDQLAYRQLWEETVKVANWLVGQDIKKQDRVAIILENSPHWVAIYFGIMLCGAVAVPLDPQMSQETIAILLADCEAKAVFSAEKLKVIFEVISGGLPGLKKMVFFPAPSGIAPAHQGRHFNFSDVIGTEAKEFSYPAIELDETASILYTSGTTAVAKGVELTHRNFSADFLSIQDLNLCSETDNLLCFLPLFHAYAFMATLVFPLFCGARMTFPASLKSEELLKCMRETGVTLMVGVPELFYKLHRAISERIKNQAAIKRLPLLFCLNFAFYLRNISRINPAKIILSAVHKNFGRQLRYLISGGARLEPNVARDLELWGFTVLEGYGLTETSPIVTFNPMDKPKIGSVGKPIKGVEVKITSPDGSGIGEVAIRGQNVMKGYYRLPEETRKVMRGGWFYSGDLGYLDKEGYLYLTGRSKEVIVLSSGKNIYPEEIEEHYGRSKFIREICVAGINQENSVALKAVIVPDLAYFQQAGLSDIAGRIKWDLENHSRELPGYKRIMGFIITREALPRTRLGKIKRYEVKEKYEKALLGEKTERQEYAPSAEETEILHCDTGVKVVDYLVKELHLKAIPSLNDHLELDLGIDSLAKVDLILGLERIFQISLPDTFLTEISTVKDLIQSLGGIAYQKLSAAPGEKTLPWKEVLRQAPKAEILENIELKPGSINRLLTWVVMRFLLILFRLFFRLEVKGREFIPDKGPYIFCCNHASFLDAFAVVASVPFKTEMDLYFIGARQIFHHSGVRWAIKLARLIPIDPTAELLSAMEVSGFLLQQGKILCIFPEGQRSIDEKVGEFKKGVGILAAELKVPLVPVAIAGSQAAWGRAVKFPKPHPIKVCFGRPINYKEFTPLETKSLTGFTKSAGGTIIDNYGFITGKLREAVINLLNEQS